MDTLFHESPPYLKPKENINLKRRDHILPRRYLLLLCVLGSLFSSMILAAEYNLRMFHEIRFYEDGSLKIFLYKSTLVEKPFILNENYNMPRNRYAIPFFDEHRLLIDYFVYKDIFSNFYTEYQKAVFLQTKVLPTLSKSDRRKFKIPNDNKGHYFWIYVRKAPDYLSLTGVGGFTNKFSRLYLDSNVIKILNAIPYRK